MQYRRLGRTGLQVYLSLLLSLKNCRGQRPSLNDTTHGGQVSVLGYGVMTFGRQTDLAAVSR